MRIPVMVVESSYSGPGLYSSLLTDEGQPMVVHYGTASGRRVAAAHRDDGADLRDRSSGAPSSPA